MSGGLLFQYALRQLRARELGELAERDVVASLEAARTGPLDFAYLAGVDARLPRAELLARGTAVFFNFAAANLTDDIADGDCTYLPIRAAPGAQFILQNLFYEVLLSTQVPRADIAQVAGELVRGASQQQREVRVKRWTLELAREVALGIAGRQYAAYLRLLWAATALAPRAVQVGTDLGVAGHVALDLSCGDPRVATLSEPDRRALVDWARAALGRLRALELDSVQAAIAGIEPALGA